MLLHNLRHGLNKLLIIIQALRALNPRLPGLMNNLQIQLMQSLDMITRKRNRHEHHLLDSLLHVPLHGLTRLGAQPRRRAHLTLPHQAEGILHAQLHHNSVNGGRDFRRVRVATVDDRHGERVSGEQDHHVVAPFRGIGGEHLAHLFGEGFDELGVRWPAVDDAPFDLAGGVEGFRELVKLVEGAAGGGAGVLGVLGEGDRARDAVGEELFVGVFCEGVGVAEGNVGLVGGCGGVGLVEEFAGFRGLDFRPFPDRRTAADYVVF